MMRRAPAPPHPGGSPLRARPDAEHLHRIEHAIYLTPGIGMALERLTHERRVGGAATGLPQAQDLRIERQVRTGSSARRRSATSR